ncbi:MAG: spondin domain-containing protein, partial [bacterium]
MTRLKMLSLAGGLFLAGMLGISGVGDAAQYEVTVTNLTSGVVFTPPLIAIHKEGVSLFNAGDPASDDLEMVAEMGDTTDLQATLDADPNVAATATIGGLIGPGQSAIVEIEAA